MTDNYKYQLIISDSLACENSSPSYKRWCFQG